MTELDERLAEALRDAVPEPPHQLDPETIRDRSARRRGTLRRYTPVLAAAVVVTIAVGVAVTRGGGGGRDNKPAGVGDPSKVVGVLWRVLALDGEPHGEGLFLRIASDGSYSQSVGLCTGLRGDLTLTGTDLTVHSVHRFFGNCPVSPDQQGSARDVAVAMKRVFTGRLAWSLNGGELTLHKDGGPTVVYTRWHPLGAPGSLNAEVVLNRTTAPATGEPVDGYLILQNNTGRPVIISNACNGWYGIGLSNDQVQNFTPAFTQVACASAELPLGVTQIPIQVRTTYAECVEPGGTASGSPPVPNCVGSSHSEVPPLPPGDYTTTVGFMGLSLQPAQAPPVQLTLTSP